VTGQPAPAGGPGSGSAATGGPAGWRPILSDSFDGGALNTSLWRMYGPNWPGHAGNGLRDTSAVSVGGGVLTITARMVGGTLVSGAIASRVSTTYGRVEFRARADADPSQATSGVVLLWPDSDNWPIDGETDIFETGTEATRASFTSAVHYGASNQQVWFSHSADAQQWQNMAVEWTPTSIRFYRNGALEGEVTDPSAIARSSQHLCVQLDAFRQSMGGSVRLQVDDVRMYALS
jgi:beta-glucanase (GH16 family)